MLNKSSKLESRLNKMQNSAVDQAHELKQRIFEIGIGIAIVHKWS